METNNIFNFKRFGKYFVSDLRTGVANYGLSLLALTVITPLALECLTGVFNMILELTWEGAGFGMRVGTFCVAMFCILVTMPAKCYGKITDKQYGAFWLMLPASRLEKFISMLLICCIIAPVIGVAVYLGVDALICVIDPTCNQNIVAGSIDTMNELALRFNFGDVHVDVAQEDLMMVENGLKFLKQITNPWLYVDEALCASLPFLLGAICFKKGKIVKTFLAMTVLSIGMSMFAGPIMMAFSWDFMTAANEEQAMKIMFESGFYDKLIWLDIVGDALLYGGIIVAIWFRIKTLKH